jgi:glycosyltransferase involved in cell wall biosynthesis
MYAFDIPANFGFPKVFFNRAVLRACVDAADAVACVSHSTLSRLRSILSKAARNKSLVIYNALATNAALACGIEPPEWRSQPFLLCVAQHRRNKNILTALQVFKTLLRSGRVAPQTRLLVVGIPGPETQSILDFVSVSDLQQNVLLLNGISDAELQWSYRNCGVLLAPSIAEGFGLPIAEALLAGCRIVCSDIPAFREIGGARCRYVSLGPGEVEAFADAVSAVLDLAPPAPVELPQFSFPVIAEEYMRLYRSLMVQPSPGNSADSPSFHFSEETQHPI